MSIPSDFDGVIDPTPEWADVPVLSTRARARGGVDGPMNAQATALVARTKKLAEDVATVTDAVGPSIADVGIDGEPDRSLFVPDGEYLVDKRPVRPLHGPGDIKYGKLVIGAEEANYPYPLYNSHLVAVDTEVGQHRGLNSHVFTWPQAGQISVVYRSSKWHGVVPSEFYMKSSTDMGISFGPRKTVYQLAAMDSRCSVSFDGGADKPWVILLCTRQPGNESPYGDAKALVSTDFGANWTTYNIPNPNNEPINFHGNLKLLNGYLVGYSYPNDRKVDAFRAPLSDLSTWTWHRGVISPVEGEEAMSETTVVTVGNTHLAFIRSATPECRIAISTDPNGLVWGTPFRSNITMGLNPYSGIEAPEQGKAWILFSDRKVDVGSAWDRNCVYSLEVSQELIDSGFTKWSFRELAETEHYSVGHVFGTRLPDGRFIATVNCGETDGANAGLYLMTPVRPPVVTRAQINEMIPGKNLILNGGFEINRDYPINQDVTANMRHRYFADGWTFVHGSSLSVTFQNKEVPRNMWTEARITSTRYLQAKSTLGANGTLQIGARMPCGHFGFRNTFTLRFKARYRAVNGNPVVPKLSAALLRTMPTQSSDSTSFGNPVEMRTFWQEYTLVKYGLYNIPPLPGDMAAGYDSLLISFNTGGTGSDSVDIDVTDIKLEVGTNASPLVLDPAIDLIECNRYFWRSDVNAQILNQAGAFVMQPVSHGSGDVGHYTVRWPTTMRKAPTVNVYSPNTGTPVRMLNLLTNADVTADAPLNVSEVGAIIRNIPGSAPSGTPLAFHIIANARP